ncbi:MAG: SAM-dependent methyltransferase [Vicingaceae bacterium]
MTKAQVYLIPNLLGDDSSPDKVLPTHNSSVIESLNNFAVENLKDARRFLVKLGLKSKIDSSSFYDLNKKSSLNELAELTSKIKSGESVGIISDAGCPGVADPGALLVKWAHENKVKVIPLIGPSSILLALMASGLSGQAFAFHGYLNRDSNKRSQQLRKMEADSKQLNQSQLFMETPYRNMAILEDVLKTLNPSTNFCIAANISLPNEYIQTKTIQEWRKVQLPNLQKQPAIFLLLA